MPEANKPQIINFISLLFNRIGAQQMLLAINYRKTFE